MLLLLLLLLLLFSSRCLRVHSSNRRRNRPAVASEVNALPHRKSLDSATIPQRFRNDSKTEQDGRRKMARDSPQPDGFRPRLSGRCCFENGKHLELGGFVVVVFSCFFFWCLEEELWTRRRPSFDCGCDGAGRRFFVHRPPPAARGPLCSLSVNSHTRDCNVVPST